jgi:hypothetical protein
MKNTHAALERLKDLIYHRACLLSSRSGYFRGLRRASPPGTYIRASRYHREPDHFVAKLDQDIRITELQMKEVIFGNEEFYKRYVKIVNMKGNGLIHAVWILLALSRKGLGQPRKAA